MKPEPRKAPSRIPVCDHVFVQSLLIATPFSCYPAKIVVGRRDWLRHAWVQHCTLAQSDGRTKMLLGDIDVVMIVDHPCREVDLGEMRRFRRIASHQLGTVFDM